MTVLVCGGTGFMGSAISRHLVAAGLSVRVLTRSPATAARAYDQREAEREALAEGRLTLVQGDVTKLDSLIAAVKGVEAVVQAAQFPGAPVEDPARGLTYDRVDRQGTENLLAAIAHEYPVTTGSAGASGHGAPVGPRFFYVSGITVSQEAPEPWNRAKWQAEEAVRASGLRWTIVRCCWAYGPGDKALNRLLGYSEFLPFVPLFGRGQQSLTPVFVEDVGRLFARLVADPGSSDGTLLGLGGPEAVTLDQFLKQALAARRRRRFLLHIPKSLGKVQASLLQHLPWRALTPDAVDFVSQGGAVTDADRSLVRKLLPDFQATTLRDGLNSYLAH